MTKAKLYKPKDLVTETLWDPETGRSVKVKAWRGNTLKVGFIGVGPRLKGSIELRRAGATTVRRKLCRRLLKHAATLTDRKLAADIVLAVDLLEGKVKLPREPRGSSVKTQAQYRAMACRVAELVLKGRPQKVAISDVSGEFGCHCRTVRTALRKVQL